MLEQKTIYIDAETKRLVMKRAKKNNRTFSQEVIYMVRNELNSDDKIN